MKKTGKSTAAKTATTPKAPAKKAATPAKKTAAPAVKSTGATTAPKGRPQSHNDLDKIMRDTLKDIYWAEKQLVKGLKKMAKNATNTMLKDAFTKHMQQTEQQVSHLEEAFGMLGMKAQGKKCAAMEGLLKEGDEHIEEYEKGPGLDSALIIGAQKIEHYEIAAYGSLRTLASTLGYPDCAAVFEEIGTQEEETDDILTDIAMTVNKEAVGAHEEENK